MSTLEALIHGRLVGDGAYAALHATCASGPAVFERQAPEDKDPLWVGDQYPRTLFLVDRQVDFARQVQGTLSVWVWTRANSASATPEALESRLRTLLDGAAFHPATEPVFVVRWARSELQEASSQDATDEQVLGYSVSFDLSAFPVQDEPAVAALNAWTAAQWPTQLQVDPTSWGADESTPAVFWRQSQSRVYQPTVSGALMVDTLVGHLLAPSVSTRSQWVETVFDRLAGTKRIVGASTTLTLALGMLRKGADAAADPFRQGQITLEALEHVRLPTAVVTPPGPTEGGVIRDIPASGTLAFDTQE